MEFLRQSSVSPSSAQVSPPSAGDGVIASRGVEAVAKPEVTSPRKRKFGAASAATEGGEPAQPFLDVDESYIFSDAISEGDEDSIGTEEAVVDYRRLQRASLAQRPSRPDYSFKVCIVGDCNVGKTSLLLSLTNGNATVGESGLGTRTPKVGIAGREKLIFSKAKRKTVNCRLEDTAGQERYKSLTSSFYRNCLGCLVVYDMTREETFNHVDGWFKDVQMYGEAEISVVLVAANSLGTLEALSQRRVVSAEEGENKAEQFDVPYVEANVRKEADAASALEILVDKMIDKLERRRSQTPMPERYLSPDPRRSYRPSTVTRKSYVAIAKAAKAPIVLPAASPNVRLTAERGQRNEASEIRHTSFCCY